MPGNQKDPISGHGWLLAKGPFHVAHDALQLSLTDAADETLLLTASLEGGGGVSLAQLMDFHVSIRTDA